MDIVPSTVVMYENGKHPIPYNVAIKLADVLEIEASLRLAQWMEAHFIKHMTF